MEGLTSRVKREILEAQDSSKCYFKVRLEGKPDIGAPENDVCDPIKATNASIILFEDQPGKQ